jgi:hypothetical protein
MGDKTDVWRGTLALMVLRTLEAMGPLHGYGLARRQVKKAAAEWEEATAILARFLAPAEEG